MFEELFLILFKAFFRKEFTNELYPRLKYFKDYYLKSYFYPVSMVKDIIHYQKGNKIQDSLFLNYKSVSEDVEYNNVNSHTFRVKIDRTTEDIVTNYCEMVNYINSPEKRIRIRSCDQNIHTLRKDVEEITDRNLAAFLKCKPSTFNGDRLLRIKSLDIDDNGQYLCDLQRTCYYNEVRTNLTVDFPYAYNKTLRLYDMCDGGLRTFSDSLLTNTIGVSAIWFTECDPLKHKNDHIHFFLKPRERGVAVYDGMLGTVSGGVRFPNENECVENQSLEEYVSKVLLEIFYKKTQYDKYMTEYNKYRYSTNHITEQDIKIIPLAFTRELLRGGLPQFFFAIKTPPIKDMDIKRFVAKHSFDRMAVFRKSLVDNALPCIFSPETMTNLLYTIQYLNKDVDIKDNGIINLNL